MTQLVGENSELEITFKLTLLDGTLVDETEEGETFRFQIGDGQILSKLDELLIGLEQGTTGTFTLMPEQAFGVSDSANYQRVSKSEFPEDMQFKEGNVIGFNTPTGDEIPGTVHQIDEETVTIDFNHPLADQVVVFEAKIEKIIS